MIETLISSSVLIILIMILRRTLRKKVLNRIIYSLWLVAAIRLMIPFGLPESPLSVMNFRKCADREITYLISERTELPDIATEIPERDHSAADNMPVPQNVKSNKTDLHSILSTVRITVACIMLAWFSAVNIMFYIKLRKSRIKYETECIIPVYVVDDLSSPCIFGIFRPSIYLNKAALLRKEKLGYIISHELCHYRHGDLIWSLLRCILVSVWWFDPLVWVGAYLSKQDCECACDESVMKNFRSEERIEYGKVLLSLVRTERPEFIGNISTSMTSGGKRLRERIVLIAKKPEKSIKVQIFMVIVILMTAMCTFTSAQTAHETNASVGNSVHHGVHIREPTASEILPEKTNEIEYYSITDSEKREYQDIATEVYFLGKMTYSKIVENGNYCQTNGNIYCSEDDRLFYEVSDSEISSAEDLKKLVRCYFSESLASQYDSMIEQNYIEFDGKLYQHTSDKDADDADYFSVNLISKDEDTLYFEAVHYEPYVAEEKKIKYYRLFSMTCENGKWKIGTFNYW